jgi:glycine/D-amino acid oxidase-like deaminating enzyme
VLEAFPTLTATEEITWLGHRPAPADSLPLIGEVRNSGVFAAFGHHHIGLTGGPKSGRMVARMISGASDNVDPAPYNPNRFS